MNTATTLGLDAVNKSRQAVVESEAKMLIECILENRKAIVVHEGTIKLEQEALGKLASDVITQQDVLGTEFSGSLNVNQVTISNVICKMNEARTEKVKLLSQSHINRITAAQEKIAAINKIIAEQQDKLAKLSASVVTVDQVVA